MRNLKKLLAVLVLVMLAGTLTACSEINKVTGYFEQQGFVRYQYNGVGDSLLFALHDHVVSELEALTTTMETTTSDQTTTTESGYLITTTTAEAETTTSVITTEGLGFTSYVFSNGVYAVIVMEFQSPEYLNDVISKSETLQERLDGLDPADYINENLLLIVLSNYMDRYDDFVEVFQGMADHTLFTTTTATTTEAVTTDTSTTVTG
ncbi:MAG: hypothetical protein JXB08_00490 [Bacilli bacterium]|nr:hypothetical protein [Bacilli bacterium]MBN2877836.1 hypothetical protein [Bacilli bacterium]